MRFKVWNFVDTLSKLGILEGESISIVSIDLSMWWFYDEEL